MDIITPVGGQWKPSGTHQRLVGLTAVKTITLTPNEYGLYIQVISQNVRMTFDSTSPAASGNDVGFQLTPAMGPIFIAGFPGMVLSFIQETATAVIQYQKLTLDRRQ